MIQVTKVTINANAAPSSGGALRYFPALISLTVCLGLCVEARAEVRGDNGNPAWSPVSNLMLFSSNRRGNSDLYLLDPDTLVVSPLVVGEGVEIHGSWSPDGKTVAFDSNRNGNMDLWLVDADGSNLRQLTSTPQTPELVPSWSPDGNRILFNRSLEDGFDVFVMDADGGNATNLTQSPGDDIARGWSPDGRRIVFNSERFGNHDIFLMDAGGESLQRLTRNPADERIALWDPDGRHIYFARSRDKAAGGRELIRLALATGEESVFFDSPHEDFYPVFSADGERAVLVVRHEGGSDLYEISTSGEILRRLTN